VSELRRGKLSLWKQLEDPTGTQSFRAQPLLGFSLCREWHHHGSSAGGENVEDCIIPGLAHRYAAAPQHAWEFLAIALEDYVFR
jgi:hypothetical protein